MSETQEQRIAREEAYWNAPRLFVYGFVILGFAIGLLLFMAEAASLFGWDL